MRVKVERENMTVDLVVWQAFGRQDEGLVEQVLALNPDIADIGIMLPVGIEVELPEPQARPRTRQDVVRLWS